jgi:hypothetical protein
MRLVSAMRSHQACTYIIARLALLVDLQHDGVEGPVAVLCVQHIHLDANALPREVVIELFRVFARQLVVLYLLVGRADIAVFHCRVRLVAFDNFLYAVWEENINVMMTRDKVVRSTHSTVRNSR